MKFKQLTADSKGNLFGIAENGLVYVRDYRETNAFQEFSVEYGGVERIYQREYYWRDAVDAERCPICEKVISLVEYNGHACAAPEAA